MNLNKIAKQLFTLVFVLTVIYSCCQEVDYCPQRVNTPRWDPVKKTFVDNFQKKSCTFDSEKSVDKTVK